MVKAAYRLKVHDLARRKIAEDAAETNGLPAGILARRISSQTEEEAQYLIESMAQRWKGATGRPIQSREINTARQRCAMPRRRRQFLGKFDTTVVTDGTVVIINLELSTGMMRRWRRDQGITHQSCIKVIPMRGHAHSLNMTLPEVRSRWAKFLIGLGATEDKDTSKFLTGFDAMLAEASVADAIVIHHMGHRGERARGDSGIVGCGNALWKATCGTAQMQRLVRR